MLDKVEMSRRITLALKEAPRGTAARIVDELDITPQAIVGWKETGKIDKNHIPVLARHTDRKVQYFLELQVRDKDSRLDSGGDPDWPTVLGSAESMGLGQGRAAQEWEQAHKLKFRADSLKKKHLIADNLRVTKGDGPSMEPTIRHGDAILFDLSDTTPRNKMIYALLLDGEADEEYNIKRCVVSRGVVTFVADNPDGGHEWKEPRPYDKATMKIVGRVRWVGRWVD